MSDAATPYVRLEQPVFAPGFLRARMMSSALRSAAELLLQQQSTAMHDPACMFADNWFTACVCGRIWKEDARELEYQVNLKRCGERGLCAWVGRAQTNADMRKRATKR